MPIDRARRRPGSGRAPAATLAAVATPRRHVVLRRVTLVSGVVLFALSLVGAVESARRNERVALDRHLELEVESHVSLVEAVIQRNSATVRLLARHDAISEYVTAQAAGDAATAASAAPRAVDALSYIEVLESSSISEVCLIRASGQEAARVVRGHVATAAELDSDETDSVFFAPTLQLGPDDVYMSASYRSSDTDTDVVGFAALVPPASGASRSAAFVHFELALDRVMGTAGPHEHFGTSIVDAATGAHVFDDLAPLRDPDARAAVIAAAAHAPEGVVEHGGHRYAFRFADTGAHSANHWLFVSGAPQPSSWFTGQFGWLWIVTVLAGAALTLLAGHGFRSYQKTLEHSARTDGLTGLPNRVRLHERVREVIAATDSDDGFAVMLIDLDRFKEVNDTLGHHQGDTVLREVARRLSTALPGAFVARLGGDEFAVLFPRGSGPREVIESAWNAHRTILERVDLDGTAVGIDASFGIAIFPEHGSDADTLIQRADIAMYHAKRNASGIGVYRADTDANSARRLELAAELRDAIANRSLTVSFQPQYRLSTNELCGAEALVRWRHERFGRIEPREFIPIAEQTGLIVALTDVVLDIVLGHVRQWLDSGFEIRVAVNIPARCVTDPAFRDRVERSLATHGVPPRLLQLEITESSLVFDPQRATVILSRLSNLGVRLSIDDFGTGYSSLAYLRSLPIDELKIDRVFISSLRDGTPEDYIVRSTIQLGHDLGLEIVAEGVEDEARLDYLRNSGCDVGQGFLLGKPMSSGDFVSRMRRDRRRAAGTAHAGAPNPGVRTRHDAPPSHGAAGAADQADVRAE